MDSDLKDELTCPICMELFRRPLRLPCGHSYCRDCLKAVSRQTNREAGPTGDIKCPECRYTVDVPYHKGVDAFQVDFKLSKLVDAYLRIEKFEIKTKKHDGSNEDGTYDGTNENGTAKPPISDTRKHGGPNKDATLTVPTNPSTSENLPAGDVGQPEQEVAGACGFTPSAQQHLTSRDHRVSDRNPRRAEIDGADGSDYDNDGGIGKKNEPNSKLKKNRRHASSHVTRDQNSDNSDRGDSSEDDTPRPTPSGQRKLKRRNKVLRFFSSLLSLSSSDDESNWRTTSSLSSSDTETKEKSKPLSKEQKESKKKKIWSFFASSSSTSGEDENVISSSDDELLGSEQATAPWRERSTSVDQTERKVPASRTEDGCNDGDDDMLQ